VEAVSRVANRLTHSFKRRFLDRCLKVRLLYWVKCSTFVVCQPYRTTIFCCEKKKAASFCKRMHAGKRACFLGEARSKKRSMKMPSGSYTSTTRPPFSQLQTVAAGCEVENKRLSWHFKSSPNPSSATTLAPIGCGLLSWTESNKQTLQSKISRSEPRAQSLSWSTIAATYDPITSATR
jgi:hypothetical protein